jgi:hypothetical protein
MAFLFIRVAKLNYVSDVGAQLRIDLLQKPLIPPLSKGRGDKA